MRVLLDECLPRRLKTHLSPHAVITVPEAGWAGLKNGDLLARADGRFDASITIDRNLTSQQNLGRFRLRLIVVKAKSNTLADLVPLVPDLVAAVDTCKPGEAVWVG